MHRAHTSIWAACSRSCVARPLSILTTPCKKHIIYRTTLPTHDHILVPIPYGTRGPQSLDSNFLCLIAHSFQYLISALNSRTISYPPSPTLLSVEELLTKSSQPLNGQQTPSLISHSKHDWSFPPRLPYLTTPVAMEQTPTRSHHHTHSSGTLSYNTAKHSCASWAQHLPLNFSEAMHARH